MNGRWPSNFLLTHSSGCVKIGVKKVDAGHWSQPTRGTYENSNLAQQGVEYVLKETGQKVGYADPDGLETVDDWRCTENCPVAKLGAQSGNRKSGARTKDYKHRGMIQAGHAGKNVQTSRCEASEGTVARFYFQADWSYERIEWEELWGEVM